ncbi:GntT/GntP/DsdX family permease, partial [Symbiopectobacterium sp.]|uniref:GntT/GntP/DsdX family permease n=1 Tax=Symbiopectobacterium sp. TaxID=2952789 RepID=UPI003F322544
MNFIIEALPIIWVALGVVLPLILNMKFKINGMLALLLAAMFVGVCEGLPLEAIGKSIENGVGSTLGHLALIRHSAPTLRINSTVSLAENINDGLVNRIEVGYLWWSVTNTE